MVILSPNISDAFRDDVCFIKSAKLYICKQKRYEHEDGHTASGVRGHGSRFHTAEPLWEHPYEHWITHTEDQSAACSAWL